MLRVIVHETAVGITFYSLGPLEWAATAYVTWFCFSSFFLPLGILTYCYFNICAAIKANINAKQRGNLVSLSTAAATAKQHRSGKTSL
jgi:hypothetical protein